jgi:amidohydrolase
VTAAPARPADGLEDVVAPAAALYVDLHRHPELSGAERRTAGRLADWLRADGFEVATGIGGHGTVGLLRNGDGPVVMVRAELDALPVREQTGLAYGSTVTVPGDDGPVPVMHACGHDLHVAAAAGAARLLARRRASWRGTLMVAGQPAEETLSGARAMLDDGLYDRFGVPSVVLAQHLAPLPAGMVAHGAGPLLAGSVSLRVVLHGRGGHAATPQATVDPVVAAAALVLRLQTIVAREVSPADQVVVSVGRLRAGAVGNVVADRAELDLTVRALSATSLARAEAAVRRIVAGEAMASGCERPPDVLEVSRSRPLVPDPEAAAAVAEAHRGHLGKVRVTGWPPSMASEDVSWFADPPGRGTTVPLVYWMLGSAGHREWSAAAPGGSAADKMAALPPNHSPRFAPAPAPALRTGVTALVAAAAVWLDADR